MAPFLAIPARLPLPAIILQGMVDQEPWQLKAKRVSCFAIIAAGSGDFRFRTDGLTNRVRTLHQIHPDPDSVNSTVASVLIILAT